MKELFSYQEIGTLIDQGMSATFTRHIQARVTVSRPSSDNETVKALLLSLGNYNIGIVEMEYEDISELLEAFDIDDKAEIWEVGDEEKLKKWIVYYAQKYNENSMAERS